MSIEVKNLIKTFGDKTVINDVSFKVQNGETLAIVGFSGSGKSTILKLICGLITPDSGEIVTSKGDIAMVFQYSALFDSLNVSDNIAFALRERKDLRNKYTEKVWYLFSKDFLSLPRDSSYFVLFKNTNYKVVQRRNFCRLLIQYDDNKFFELENVDIFIFEYHGNHSYSIETNKGTLIGQFTSRSFISAFAKVLSLNSSSNDRNVFTFILYMDGRFERITNNPIIAKF